MANMKSRCIGQVRDHIKACPSVPENVKHRLIQDYDHSIIQRQLNAIEGRSLDKLLHRLWLRLYHDFSKRKEIDAIARTTPLFYESDDSLFSSSSGDDACDYNDIGDGGGDNGGSGDREGEKEART